MNSLLQEHISNYGYSNILIINTIDLDIINSIKDVIKVYDYISCDELSFLFISSLEQDVSDTLYLLQSDLSINFKCVYGLHLTKSINIEELINNLLIIKEYFLQTNELITSYSSLFFKNWNKLDLLITYTYNTYIKWIFNNTDNYQLLKSYFNNNLNVLKTSKEVYLSRGSILFRFKTIFIKSSFNLENFYDASAFNLILNKTIKK